MLNLFTLLASTGDTGFKEWTGFTFVINLILVLCMAAAAVLAIIFILMQPSNSSGIDALGGSSETFFGKNKGKSIEAKMKKWTWICLAVIVVLSIVFFLIQ